MEKTNLVFFEKDAEQSSEKFQRFVLSYMRRHNSVDLKYKARYEIDIISCLLGRGYFYIENGVQ